MMGCKGLLPPCREEFNWRTFGVNHPQPRLFFTAQWNSWPRYVFILHCVFWALWHTVWIIAGALLEDYNWASSQEDKIKWFVYLTNWAYLILTISTLFRAFTAVYYNTGNRGKGLEELPTVLRIQWVIHNMANGTAIGVTIAYWALVYSGDTLHYISIFTHAINSVYVIADVIIAGHPIRFLHFIHPLIFAVCYGIFNAIYDTLGGTNANGRDYVYSVLDWSRDWKYALGIFIMVAFVLQPACHFLLYGIQIARRVVAALFDRSFVSEKSTKNETVAMSDIMKDEHMYSTNGDSIPIVVEANSDVQKLKENDHENDVGVDNLAYGTDEVDSYPTKADSKSVQDSPEEGNNNAEVDSINKQQDPLVHSTDDNDSNPTEADNKSVQDSQEECKNNAEVESINKEQDALAHGTDEEDTNPTEPDSKSIQDSPEEGNNNAEVESIDKEQDTFVQYNNDSDTERLIEQDQTNDGDKPVDSDIGEPGLSPIQEDNSSETDGTMEDVSEHEAAKVPESDENMEPTPNVQQLDTDGSDGKVEEDGATMDERL